MQWEGPKGVDVSAIAEINVSFLAPSPSTEFGDLPFTASPGAEVGDLPLAAFDQETPLSSLPEPMNSDGSGLIAAETMNAGLEVGVSGEPNKGNLDGDLFSVPDADIWGESQGDVSPAVDTETYAIPEQDSLFSLNDVTSDVLVQNRFRRGKRTEVV